MAVSQVRTVLTLRARRMVCGDPPRAGELMASASGRTVYRVLAVVLLRTAGDPLGNRYRLTCGRLARCAVPGDAPIHPWRWDRSAPRQSAQDSPGRPSVAIGSPTGVQNASRTRPRPATRVSDETTFADLGPGLRRRAARDKRGRLLRELDVEVDEQAVDPRYPNRRLRRAYRVDPVDHLRRVGTIGAREVDAAAELRKQLEHISPHAAGGNMTRWGTAPHQCQPITDEHIRASRKLREASAALGERLWPVVLWVCLGGSVAGYAAQWNVGEHRTSKLVANGMTRLGDHFYGRRRAA